MKAGHLARWLDDCETMGDVMDVFLGCSSYEQVVEFIEAYAAKNGWALAKENLSFGLSYYGGFPNIENVRNWAKMSGLLANKESAPTKDGARGGE